MGLLMYRPNAPACSSARRIRLWGGPCTLFALLLAGGLLCPSKAAEWRLEEAVEQAMARYGSVQVSEAQVREAAATLRLARTAYLPSVDAISQLNRATRNNVFGLQFPQGLPSVSGPPLERNDTRSVWGSAVGFLVSWEPFDFGLRKAQEAVARHGQQRAEAAVQRSRHELAVLASDAFLTVVAAEETLKQAEASVKRAEVFEQVVSALVSAELRPGVELSRARAETAAARIQVVQAKNAIHEAKALLARFLEVEPASLQLDGARFRQAPETHLDPATSFASHPAVMEQQAVIEEAAARVRAAEKAWAPRFELLASISARGTGARASGEVLGGFNGFGPTIHNWAAGVGVTFPLLDRPSLRANREREAARHRGEQHRRQQMVADLTAQRNAALGELAAALETAALLPIQAEAARATERQALARYEAGMTTAVDVADAQRQLTRVEVDFALSRLAVWRAMLGVANASGDIDLFLNEVRR